MQTPSGGREKGRRAQAQQQRRPRRRSRRARQRQGTSEEAGGRPGCRNSRQRAPPSPPACRASRRSVHRAQQSAGCCPPTDAPPPNGAPTHLASRISSTEWAKLQSGFWHLPCLKNSHILTPLRSAFVSRSLTSGGGGSMRAAGGGCGVWGSAARGLLEAGRRLGRGEPCWLRAALRMEGCRSGVVTVDVEAAASDCKRRNVTLRMPSVRLPLAAATHTQRSAAAPAHTPEAAAAGAAPRLRSLAAGASVAHPPRNSQPRIGQEGRTPEPKQLGKHARDLWGGAAAAAAATAAWQLQLQREPDWSPWQVLDYKRAACSRCGDAGRPLQAARPWLRRDRASSTNPHRSMCIHPPLGKPQPSRQLSRSRARAARHALL